MPDSAETVSAEQFAREHLDDWHYSATGLQARYATGDFAAGLRFVNAIGERAEAANHHPDLQLSYPEVVVSLVSHDVGGVTRRDIEIARAISALAKSANVAAS